MCANEHSAVDAKQFKKGCSSKITKFPLSNISVALVQTGNQTTSPVTSVNSLNGNLNITAYFFFLLSCNHMFHYCDNEGKGRFEKEDPVKKP
jgi:hypothetical protein